MKTSGLREIDFTKIDCKNCGRNSIYQPSIGYIPSGMILDLECSNFRIKPCPVCKGIGYIDETGEELELE